jgi:tripartite-type tricarboxylate transporter receptor subunit TctC
MRPSGGSAMKLSRRQFLHLAPGIAALPLASAIASAQAYPTRPITLVVPIAAGGATDTAARIIAEKLQRSLQQSVVVDNRPGAGSVIGTNFVAKSAPDGYTLLLMEPGAVLAKWLNKAAPFDVTSNFSPIAMFAISPLVLFAHPSVPFKNVEELIAYAKSNPGKLSVGTPGIGTPHHLAAAWLNTGAKIDITHVSYRGAAPALNDLLGGQIPLIWASPVAVMPFVEEGKVKALAISSQQRDRTWPGVPTVAESGVPGFDTANWFGIVAPAGVRPEVVARVGQAVREAIDNPDVQKRMAAVGLHLEFRDSDQFRELIVNSHQKYGTIIREVGIRPS